jgi:hypothetical protein
VRGVELADHVSYIQYYTLLDKGMTTSTCRSNILIIDTFALRSTLSLPNRIH